MKSILDFFQVNKYPLLIATFVLMALAGHWVNSSNEKLITNRSPNKIVSLELAWSDFRANRILEAWEKMKGVDTAIYSIQQDFLFIITYTLFLCCCVLAINGPGAFSRWTKIALACLLAAFAGDVIENIFMLRFLARHPTPPFAFSFPATIKLIAIVL